MCCSNRESAMSIEMLPVEDWCVQFYPDFVAVAAHQNGGGLYWTKYRLSDFPKNLVSLDNLKSVFIDIVDARTVQQGTIVS